MGLKSCTFSGWRLWLGALLFVMERAANLNRLKQDIMQT